MIFFTFNCSVTAYYYYWPAFSINKGDFEILFIHLSRKSLWQHFLRVISETIVLFCFAFTDHFLPLPLAFFIVPNPWHSQGSLFKAITNCFLLCPDCCEIAEKKSEKMAIQEKWNILRFQKKYVGTFPAEDCYKSEPPEISPLYSHWNDLHATSWRRTFVFIYKWNKTFIS